jgi:hypothetical protein
MHSFARSVILLLLAAPAWATAQNAQEASRIGGAIYPSMLRPSPSPAPGQAPGAHPPFATADVRAVCLGASTHADRCPAQTHTAFCDMESTGLSKCLSQYANVLVKHPDQARRSVNVALTDGHGALGTVTVLAKGNQSREAIAQAAWEGMP